MQLTPGRALLASLLVPAAIAWSAPADDVVAGVTDPALRVVLDDVLARNPAIAAARARALAAAQVAPQERALPDPWLMVTAFPQSPDAQAGVEVTQEIPGAGKRRLRADVATREASAAEEDLEAVRLDVVQEARDTWLEIAYLDEAALIAQEERETLIHFESLARGRYSSGEGLQQEVVRLQAEITRTELELVEIQAERLVAVVGVNALRGLPGRLELAAPSLPPPPSWIPDARRIVELGAGLRPDLRAAEARIGAAAVRADLARRERSPDVMVRGGWTFMRGEGMGGKDGLDSDEAMFGFGISLPVRNKKLVAMLEQATQERNAAVAERDALALSLERQATQVAGRLELTVRQLRLNEDVLAIQAAEALRSAEAAYATGLAGSLELLDAERELFEIRKGGVRALADIAMLTARLEGLLGAPLALLSPPLADSVDTEVKP